MEPRTPWSLQFLVVSVVVPYQRYFAFSIVSKAMEKLNAWHLNRAFSPINRRFGTYRGAIRLALAEAERAAGRLSEAQRIEWDRVRRVVFVCQGNICRSAFAHRVADQHDLHAASFGLASSTGMTASPDAIKIAA